jgi:RES domain-containing protein
MVYCSESLALATLESIAHLSSPKSLRGYLWFSVNLPDDLIEMPQAMPQGWNAKPGEDGYRGAVSARFGSTWFQEQRSIALKVPSAVVPSEYNIIVNPLHPKFDLSMIDGPFPIVWDERLT